MNPDKADAGGPQTGIVKNLIAVVGCDGTGKSTLTHELEQRLRETRPTQWHYMGLISGEMGDHIKDVPVIGEQLERYLDRRAQRAQNVRNKLPGLTTAAIMYAFSIWRETRLHSIVALARSGTVVITDRYPQAEIPGFHYDGPGIGIARSRGRLVTRLAQREQAIYERMAKLRPQLVVRLNIDPQTAHARKPDHDPAELRDKIVIMQKLQFNGSEIVEIDTRPPYAEVFSQVWSVVTKSLDGLMPSAVHGQP